MIRFSCLFLIALAGCSRGDGGAAPGRRSDVENPCLRGLLRFASAYADAIDRKAAEQEMRKLDVDFGLMELDCFERNPGVPSAGIDAKYSRVVQQLRDEIHDQHWRWAYQMNPKLPPMPPPNSARLRSLMVACRAVP